MKQNYPVTTQKQIRAMFWQAHPEADRKKIRDHSGKGRMYKADTRMVFVDYVDALQRSGMIAPALAQRVTL